MPDPIHHSEPVGPRLVAIDGLRGIAAGSVFIYHVAVFTPLLHQGPLLDVVVYNLRYGLVLFFVISGFLLFRPLAGSLIRGTPAPSARRFLFNRAMRILPAYWFVLVIVHVFFAPPEPFSRSERVLFFLLMQNLDVHTRLQLINTSWTLCVEAVFYLVLAGAIVWLGALTRRSLRAGRPSLIMSPRHLAVILLAAGLLSWASGAVLLLSGSDPRLLEPPWLSFWYSAQCFVPGMLLAVLHAQGLDWHAQGLDWQTTGRRTLIKWAPAAGGLLLVAASTATWSGGHFHTVGLAMANLFVATAFALLIAPLVLTPGGPASRLLASPLFRGAGLVSYSFYLWHHPVLVFMEFHLGINFAAQFMLRNILVAGAATLLLSIASYLAVERPALRVRVNWASLARQIPVADSLPR